MGPLNEPLLKSKKLEQFVFLFVVIIAFAVGVLVLVVVVVVIAVGVFSRRCCCCRKLCCSRCRLRKWHQQLWMHFLFLAKWLQIIGQLPSKEDSPFPGIKSFSGKQLFGRIFVWPNGKFVQLFTESLPRG